MNIAASKASLAFAAGVVQRLLGRIREAEFRPMRLFNGVYLQLHGYMLRVALIDAQLSSRQLLALAQASCKYDRGYFHITTRQTIQFNWVSLAAAAKLTKLLSKTGLSSAHTSGNCVRQITCDPLWGVCLDEAANIIGLVSSLRQQVVLNPNIELLPKKVKMCIYGAFTDRVLSQFNDIGIRLTATKAYVTLGGGLGRAPAAGIRLVKLRISAVCCWLVAFLRVYCALSSTHKYSLRTKALVRSLGKLALFKLTSKELCINASARPMALISASETRLKSIAVVRWLKLRAFEKWYCQHTWAHRVFGVRLVLVGNTALPPGDVTSAAAKELAVLAQRYCMDQIRLTLTQTLVLPWVPNANISNVYSVCARYSLHNVVCCPGLDYCVLANARSILVALKLALIKTALNIRVSGCVNACSQHHVFDIGIVGVNKANAEAYQVFVGGCARAGILARPISRAAPARKAIAVVYKYCALVRLLLKDSFECAYSCRLRARISLRG
ncbi:MAG: nitrite/sulfite reductase [Candidatus Hodgkinia cicadicola]